MTPIEIHNELLAGHIIKHLEQRNFNAHYCATAAEAIALIKSLMPEGSSISYFLTSANAITQDGIIVNIDGRGNRVAAITWGPHNVIHVIGMNKVTPTIEAALARARNTAAPINTARLGCNTPCKFDGVCHNCNSPQCICNYIHFTRNSFPAHRHTVVLVGENWGY